MIELSRNGKHSHRNGSGHAPSNGNGRPEVNGNGRPAGEPRVTIRPLSELDSEALRRLAERDTTREPDGAVVGAERDGRLLAALSLSSGEIVADPFHPTADLVALLRLRAGQVLPPPS